MSYQTAVGDLRDFLILAGTSAATLVGLLFVGLSLHLRVVIASPEVRSLARVTLANFGVVLLVSMFMVIAQGRTPAGWELIGSGLASLVTAVPSLLSAARSQRWGVGMRPRGWPRFVLRFGLSCAGYVAIITAGLLLLASRFDVFEYLLVANIVVLLVVSLRNTWDLLVTVGQASAEREGGT